MSEENTDIPSDIPTQQVQIGDKTFNVVSGRDLDTKEKRDKYRKYLKEKYGKKQNVHRKLNPEITSNTDYLTNIRRRPIPFSERFKRWMGESWINQGLVTIIILVIFAVIFNLIGLYK